jgi:hypothetical protein
MSIITKFEIENNRYDFEFDEDDEDVVSAYISSIFKLIEIFELK